MTLKLNKIFEELAETRNQIADLKDRLAPLLEHEEKLRGELLAELKSKGMKTINSDLTGELYTRSERFSFKVNDEEKALKFATKHNALKVDTTKITKLLRTPDAPLPEDVGFETQVTEYLSIKSNNNE